MKYNISKRKTKEEIKKIRQEYYLNNREEIKRNNLANYHKTKVLKPKKEKTFNRKEYHKQYWIENKDKYTNKRKPSERIIIGGEYDKHKYWRFIQNNNILGRYINENVFTLEDKKYIEGLKG